ncbi:MAG: hypothetical protein BM558_14400 [Roseobacter sp. MedPE-SW]|nr:MAG: hypothetical protein BM558_14400 [Roseobacter sp. MedPE-SW]
MVKICDWTEVLEDDERLLWQGRPGTGIVVSTAYYLFAFNIAILSAVHYFYSNAREPYFTAVSIFYVILFCVMTAWGLVWPSVIRRCCKYAVTNKRALVAVQKPFTQTQITSYPAQDWTPLVLTDKAPANLYFTSRKILALRAADRNVQVGFEQISNGNDVHKIMQDVQSARSQD